MALSIKTRLTLGSLFLFALMMTSVVLGLYYLIAVDDGSKAVLAENYDSVRHIHGMHMELDRALIAGPAAITGIDSLLRAQEGNITEPGERSKTAELRGHFEAWKRDDAAAITSMLSMRRDLDALLDLNLNAIARKSEQAQENAGHALFWLFLLAILITLIGLGFSVAFPTVISAPIVRLKEAVHQLAAHNYRHRIPPFEMKELDELAGSFNLMAHELEVYDNSNLARLMTEKNRAEAVINTLQDASIGVDHAGLVLFANRHALALLTLVETDVVGHPTAEVAQRSELFRAIIQGERGRPIEWNTGNTTRFLLPNVMPIQGGKGPLGTLYLIQDITHFQERDRAKTNFLATISHELKTPLASNDIGLTLLERETGGPLSTEQRAIISDLRKDHQRLVRIVGELLDLAQAETGNIRLHLSEPRAVDVVQSALDAVKASAQQKNIGFDLRTTDDDQRMRADADKAAWVLVNLLTNAVRHSPLDGLISIHSRSNEGQVVITVTDQGPGIPARQQRSLFDRFAHGSDPKGTGLGLSIAREFMRAMDGPVSHTIPILAVRRSRSDSPPLHPMDNTLDKSAERTGFHAHPLSIAGLLVTLGIIYGDIGTSPLYVMKAIIGDREISEKLVFGGISCVFWTLTIQTTFKYILLTLRADNRGEGGIFSLYALVRRYAKWIYLPTILGAATLMADGIITPPISVSSAVEGLGGVKAFAGIIIPGNKITVAIVVVILSCLFFFQRFGTKVVGYAFGPIMLIWFSMLLVLGLSGISGYPHVLQSLNPWFAYQLLAEYHGGFWILGAVFLCTTGAEALYSDLGHCGRKNIQVSWIFVKTALVINYMGQGAWVLSHGGTHLDGANPFYALMPHWFLLVGVVIATVAAIIASQALISGSFTLISEAIQLNFWPRVRVKFPTVVRGQIYIPSVNWILWSGCVAIMLLLRQSANMEAAYGFFIVIAMLMTTTLIFGYLRFVRKWHLFAVLPVMGLFFTVEVAYLVANSAKIAQRPWLVVSVFSLVAVMYIWYRARKITNRFLEFVRLTNYAQALRDLSDDKEIPKFATHLVYLTKADNARNVEKQVVDSILARKVKRADIYWFVHVNYTDAPYTMNYRVQELIDDKVIRVDFDLGFRVQPRINMLFKRVLEDLDADHELEFRSKYESIKKGDFHTDICYVLTERVLSVENEFNFRKDAILDSYYALKRLALTDRDAFGLDPNVTVVEQVPLVITEQREMPLKRIGRLP